MNATPALPLRPPLVTRDDAARFVTDPAAVAAHPGIATWAWFHLKSTSGHPVRQYRLRRLPGHPCPSGDAA